MSGIASQTPEGCPGRCPICGAYVVVQPAEPLDDAPCPHCGVLLWPLKRHGRERLLPADAFPRALREKLRSLPENLRDMDSLDCVEAVMAIEEEFEIVIPDRVAEQWKTTDDFLRWWQSRDSESE